MTRHPTPDPWAHPDVLGKIWTVGELADCLTNLGWQPLDYDPNAEYLHDETREVLANDETVFVHTTEARAGQPLTRFHAWLSPDGTTTFRLPRDRDRRATIYDAACVVALLAEEPNDVL